MMLFARCVGSIRNERFHLFPAAFAADAGVLDVRDNVAAVFTTIECHGVVLLIDQIS